MFVNRKGKREFVKRLHLSKEQILAYQEYEKERIAKEMADKTPTKLKNIM